MERFHFAAFADYIAKRFQGELVSAETDRDHMHLLVSLTPNTNLSVFVRSIKAQISREMRSKYPDKIGKYLYGKDTPFWSESYFVATTGNGLYGNRQGIHRKPKDGGASKRSLPETAV